MCKIDHDMSPIQMRTVEKACLTEQGVTKANKPHLESRDERVRILED